MNKRQTVSDWINVKFIEWETEIGRKKSITEFSKFLDVNRVLLGKWMNGTALPGNENVIKLGNKLGYEIYDLLEWVKPELPKD